MKVLALDTACAACSAAVWHDGAITGSRMAPMSRGHAEALLPMVLDVMGASSTSFSALDIIAVTLGPGSFTGLRTGLAAAKGFALAHDLPIVGVTSLEAVALAAERLSPPEARGLPIYVVLETRRGSVYLQRFASDLAPLDAPCVAALDDVVDTFPAGGVVLAGDAASRIVLDMDVAVRERGVKVIEAVKGPDAKFVAEISAGRCADGGVDEDTGALTPLYIQEPEARRPIAGGRLRL